MGERPTVDRSAICHIAIPIREGSNKGLTQSIGEAQLENGMLMIEMAQDGSAFFFQRATPGERDELIPDGPIVCVETKDIVRMVIHNYAPGGFIWQGFQTAS